MTDRPPDASKQPQEALTETRRRKAADSALRREIARTVPSDAQIDALSEVTDEDIRHAVRTWDAAQREGDTGLDGLLSARVQEDD